MKKLITFLFTFLILLSCSNTEKKKITLLLDWTPNTNHTGIFVAKELGYFDDLDTELEVQQPAQGSVVQLVATNEAQFGIEFQPSLAKAIEKNMPITAVMSILQHNTAGLLSLKYDSIEQLKGKRFSTWQDPIDEATVKHIVGDDIVFVPSDTFDALAGLKHDQYDYIMVYKGWDYIFAKNKEPNIKFFPLIDYEPTFDYYTPVIIANNDFIRENKELTKKIISRIVKGYEYAMNNPDKSIDLVSKYMDVDINLLKQSQRYISTQYKATSEKIGLIDLDRWKAFYDFLYKNKLIKKEQQRGQGVTDEFVK